MTYRLFLDDERMPPDDGNEWFIVRSAEQAMAFVIANGMPKMISFDHDLAAEKTGKDFANWLVDYIMDHDVDITNFQFYVHSQNPQGAANIRNLLESFIKSRS